MTHHYFQGQPVDDARSRVCVLFDPRDGRIVHGHGVTILDADNALEPSELEARARKHATNLGIAVDELKALHLPIEAIRGQGAVKVNATGDGVVPIPGTPRRGRTQKRP